MGLLLAGGLGSMAMAIWIATLDDPSLRSVATARGGELRRGISIIATSPWASRLYAALVAGAVVGVGLFVAARLRPWRWPFIAATVVALGSIYPVWLARDWAAEFEYEGFRRASRYVEATDQLAVAVTIYLIALAVLAAAAAALHRRS